MVNTGRPRPRIPLSAPSSQRTRTRSMVSKIRGGFRDGHYGERWAVWEDEDLGEENNRGLLAVFDTQAEALAYLEKFSGVETMGGMGIVFAAERAGLMGICLSAVQLFGVVLEFGLHIL